MKRFAALAALAAACFALPAAAQVLPGWYAGGGAGLSKANFSCASLVAGAACDNTDRNWKIFGGYGLNANASIELGYADLGKTTANAPAGSAQIRTRAFELSALVALPLRRDFAVLGRLGAFNGDNRMTGVATGSRTTTDLTFGVGLQYDLTDKLQLRGEWQRYKDVKAVEETTATTIQSDIDVWGVSLVLRFR